MVGFRGVSWVSGVFHLKDVSWDQKRCLRVSLEAPSGFRSVSGGLMGFRLLQGTFRGIIKWVSEMFQEFSRNLRGSQEDSSRCQEGFKEILGGIIRIQRVSTVLQGVSRAFLGISRI